MRKFIFTIICLLSPLTMDAQIIRGDMDKDGNLDAKDVADLVSTIIGKKSQEYITINDFVDNSAIAGVWYKSKTESVSFIADGTTNYGRANHFMFIPSLNYIILCDASGNAMGILNATLQDENTLNINQTTTYTKYIPETYVSSITLTAYTLQMYAEASVQLNATVLPEDADNKSLIWTSSDESVATVSNGVITAVAEGTATITCKAVDGSNVSASCNVTVSHQGNPGQQVSGGMGA